jgi:hypothetical protein
LDANEVQVLNQKQQEREDAFTSPRDGRGRKKQKLSAVSKPTTSMTNSATHVSAPTGSIGITPVEKNQALANSVVNDATATALASAALLAYQSKITAATKNEYITPAVKDTEESAPASGIASSGINFAKQLDWRQLLHEKSNLLSPQDRVRVQQFFEERFNPSSNPADQIYKMKLHEERITDPETGERVKDTYYLELNYDTFTSKQSKKRKRYGDG